MLRAIGSFLARRDRKTVGVVSKRNLSPITVEQARNCATVASAVDTCARAVAQLEFVAEGRGARHSVNRLLKRPNDYQPPYTFWHGVVEDLLFEGNAITRIIRGLSGEPMFLAPLQPQHIQMNVGDTAPEYQSTETGRTYPASEIVHTRDAGGTTGWSESRISKAGTRIMALICADRLIQDTFEHGISMSYWVDTSKSARMSLEDRKALAIAMQDSFGNTGDRRGSFVVMPPEAVLNTIEGLKPADADLRALRQDLIREIAAMFGVPPFRAGATSDTKYSNYTAAMLTFYRDSVVPIVTCITQSFGLALGTEITADTSRILEGDLKTQVDIALTAAGVPILTPNQARVVAGFEPETGDPEMDKVHLTGSAGTDRGDRSGEMPSDDGATDAGGIIDDVA